jgi:uncharacterized SAM-binding protein YcdF (DUF218 family)
MFVLSKLVWLLASPDAILVLALALGTALLWTPRWRAGRVILVASAVAALAVAALPVGPWLIIPLEDRFPTVRRLPEHIDGIVVLGGAVSQRITHARGQPALNGAAERMTEFVALARRHPEAKLVFTGGSALIAHPELKETTVARQLFAELGLDVSRVVFEDQSRNTYENALFTRDLVRPQPGETWVLITSAFHMPRAYGCFARVGWTVVPYPVDYLTTGEYSLDLDFDFVGGLNALTFATHEWVGLLAYRLLGRTDAIFPALP